MIRNLMLFFFIIVSIACKSSESSIDESSSLIDKHKYLLELTKSLKYKEALVVAKNGIDSIKHSNITPVEQLQYLARFSNEAAVLNAHLRKYDEAIKYIDIAIGVAKELIQVDDIFYFDMFEFSGQKAKILSLYKGSKEESAYRFQLLSEISQALQSTKDNFLIRKFETNLSKLIENCATSDMQFCKLDLVEHCEWMKQNYKKYLVLDTSCRVE